MGAPPPLFFLTILFARPQIQDIEELVAAAASQEGCAYYASREVGARASVRVGLFERALLVAVR